MPRVVFGDEAECRLFVRLVLVGLEAGGWLAAAHRGGAAQLQPLAVAFVCSSDRLSLLCPSSAFLLPDEGTTWRASSP